MKRIRKSQNRVESEPVWAGLLPDESRKAHSLQTALRMNLAQAILQGRIAEGTYMPSTRELANVLKIARVTVVRTYERLASDGYLESRKRVGYFVLPSPASLHAVPAAKPSPKIAGPAPAWSRRFISQGSDRWLEKPRDWHNYKYPFVYGQIDTQLFPLSEWRDCCRIAQGTPNVTGWASDAIDQDDPTLLEEIQSRILTKRGIVAQPENMLITLGTQMALFLIVELLIKEGTRVAIEDPGYMDARNAFQRRGASLNPVEMDSEGMIADERLQDSDYLYCTPSHQCPTGVTMSLDRRTQILEAAAKNDVVIIEDDYDAETQFTGQPHPALRALDRSERVIYIGSFSKVLFPGLRIGFLIAPAQVIERARALRRLMIRHPPLNNQRALAIFIAQGHFDMALAKKRASLQKRAALVTDALKRHIPNWHFEDPIGGSSIWIQSPAGVDTAIIEQRARERGVLIENGRPFFHAAPTPSRHARIGFSSIAEDLIDPGIKQLSDVISRHTRR